MPAALYKTALIQDLSIRTDSLAGPCALCMREISGRGAAHCPICVFDDVG